MTISDLIEWVLQYQASSFRLPCSKPDHTRKPDARRVCKENRNSPHREHKHELYISVDAHRKYATAEAPVLRLCVVSSGRVSMDFWCWCKRGGEHLVFAAASRHANVLWRQMRCVGACRAENDGDELGHIVKRRDE